MGSGFLVAAVVGSGIMGERLANGNVAIALLANTFATGAVRIARSLSDTFSGIRPADVPFFIFAQIAGAKVARESSLQVRHLPQSQDNRSVVGRLLLRAGAFINFTRLNLAYQCWRKQEMVDSNTSVVLERLAKVIPESELPFLARVQ